MEDSEKTILTKADVRRILKISRNRYKELINAGILPEPICLKEGGRAVHTQFQIEIARNNLQRRSHTPPSIGKPIKPLSEKIQKILRNKG